MGAARVPPQSTTFTRSWPGLERKPGIGDLPLEIDSVEGVTPRSDEDWFETTTITAMCVMLVRTRR